MLQAYVSNVSDVSNVFYKYFYLDIAYVAVAMHVCSKCFTCFRPMSQCFILYVAYVVMLHMFKTYIASVYSKCFICFRRMLQMCLSGYYSCYAHMLQTYVCKCVHMFQTYVAELLSCCNISRRRKWTHADAVPTCMSISRHEASISRLEVGINQHEAQNCMRRRISIHGWVGATVACGAGFFLEKVGRAGWEQQVGQAAGVAVRTCLGARCLICKMDF
jgi:hypothetical protein